MSSGKCPLFLFSKNQELVINARLLEKYGDDYQVILPDEHHFKTLKFGQIYNTEAALDQVF